MSLAGAEESYRRYGPALLRKARRLLRNEEDARDAVQTLFVELFSHDATPRDLPFLYRALTHRCLNALRDEKNRRRLLERESSALRGPVRVSPDTLTLGLDTLLKLQRSVDEGTMESVIYRFVDELSLDEIAGLMRVSRKTVYNRLMRAGEALALLSEELRGTP